MFLNVLMLLAVRIQMQFGLFLVLPRPNMISKLYKILDMEKFAAQLLRSQNWVKFVSDTKTMKILGVCSGVVIKVLDNIPSAQNTMQDNYLPYVSCWMKLNLLHVIEINKYIWHQIE